MYTAIQSSFLSNRLCAMVSLSWSRVPTCPVELRGIRAALAHLWHIHMWYIIRSIRLGPYNVPPYNVVAMQTKATETERDAHRVFALISSRVASATWLQVPERGPKAIG